MLSKQPEGWKGTTRLVVSLWVLAQTVGYPAGVTKRREADNKRRKVVAGTSRQLEPFGSLARRDTIRRDTVPRISRRLWPYELI